MSTKEPDTDTLEEDLQAAFKNSGAGAGSAVAAQGSSYAGAGNGFGGVRGRHPMTTVRGMKRMDGSDYAEQTRGQTVLGQVMETFEHLTKTVTRLRALEEQVSGPHPVSDLDSLGEGTDEGALGALNSRRQVIDRLLSEADDIIDRLSKAISL